MAPFYILLPALFGGLAILGAWAWFAVKASTDRLMDPATGAWRKIGLVAHCLIPIALAIAFFGCATEGEPSSMFIGMSAGIYFFFLSISAAAIVHETAYRRAQARRSRAPNVPASFASIAVLVAAWVVLGLSINAIREYNSPPAAYPRAGSWASPYRSPWER